MSLDSIDVVLELIRSTDRLSFLAAVVGTAAGWAIDVFTHSDATVRPLVRLVDLVPPPRLRKRLKKLLADQAAHVQKLKKTGRGDAARWIVLATWFLVAWYIFTAPVSALWQIARDRVSGAGD